MQQHRVPLHLRRRVNAFVDALQKAKGDSSAAIANTAPSDALAASPYFGGALGKRGAQELSN